MKKNIGMLFFSLCFLVACQQEMLTEIPTLPRAVPSITAHIMPTSSPTIAPTFAKASSIVQNCLQVFPNSEKLAGKKYGRIIFDRDSGTTALYNKLDNPYLYEPGINHKESIIDGVDFAVSNDRTMFAYQLKNDDERKIMVSDRNGKILAASTKQNELIKRWANDGLILWNTGNTFMFLNPFSNERKKLREDFPNRYKVAGVWSGIYGEVYYDPSLTKVLYFAKDTRTDTYYLSMWDVLADKELVRYPQIWFADSFPADWALDGEQVVIYNSSLVSIHTNGEIEILLSKGSPSFALSPDGKKLAFWLTDDDWKNWSLSVFDRDVKSTTNYCIMSKYFPEMPPLWSPDSQNLVVYPSDDMENTKAILIDIGQNLAAQIAENAKPVGWLK